MPGTEWNVFREERDELRLIAAPRAKVIPLPNRAFHEEEYDIDERTAEDRKRARNLRRRRLVKVTSTLGNIMVRIALANIGTVNRDNLHLTSLLSELAYHSPDTIRDIRIMDKIRGRIEPGFPVVVTGNEPTDPQAVVWMFTGEKTVYLAFRGNHDLGEVYYALGLSRDKSVADSTETIHPSFAKDFMGMEPHLRPQIEAVLNRVDRIIVTGHGLGAALATLAAPFYSEIFPDEAVECYTYGGPKVGGRDFSSWFKSKVDISVRVIASSDPIPFLPLGREDFTHTTDAICITKAGYGESWSTNVKPSPALLDGIDRIDFDDFSWQQSCSKYRRRVSAALSRLDRQQTSKTYITGPSKPRGA
jgi:hypothetical protein